MLLIIFFSLFIPFSGWAAVLYLEPAEGNYYHGDTFITNLRVDTENECINTIEANLNFSQDALETVDFSQGNSILTLWLKPPIIEQKSGLVSFIGGIPGGYCGILPGDPGESNLLGRIIFKIKEVSGDSTSAKVEFLESSQVLLNDGFGTPAKLTAKGAVFTILAEKLEVAKDQWQEEIEKDEISPEPFAIEIHQDPAIFEGKYFIMFLTADKQTGIDYYEIKEGKGDWKRVESPYLLEDQSLTSIIKVRAVDKAGNERIVEYIPPTVKKPFPYWIIILILVGIGVIWQIVRKIKR
ncbi:hypothetical protein COT50_02310 [candidate division WWE3 bacterium CG08_land_8_20_14_0_20_41_10]|uniref:Cohesin domain-containing protein n=1 Tax=candidate division WWE3 bacterium CG08_land_8_20_14_0_20_41_10 TaxID=1975085 RepID=A0A2H0XBR8_UNCKA|nr:MAG: hypothetical protein COT50_02310 [candidate division WWE3 bacterium CG08_land_8_20_14_0_20_41_10]